MLVDDAIVWSRTSTATITAIPSVARLESTVRAVGEIGSPTALATSTVVLSFLPMLFVTGMMGPYMRPIPINVPVAMLASLFIAFAITPWATYSLLRNQPAKSSHGTPRWIAPFRRTLASIARPTPARARLFLFGLVAALVVAIALPALHAR